MDEEAKQILAEISESLRRIAHALERIDEKQSKEA